jgi:twinkle protein
MVSGAELVMYGLDDCVGAERVVVVEGEMDALAIETATGITSILSVPNGASVNAKMNWLQSAESIYEHAHTVVLAMDNDEPGVILEKELARRIGKEKCYRTVWPEGCKDANDVLEKKGAKTLIGALKDAAPYPESGILTATSAKREFFDLYNGVHVKGVPTGWDALDLLWSVRTGELTVVTGAPGSGKSELIDALMVNLGMREKWSFIVFSPENLPLQLHLKKLAEKYVGKPFNTSIIKRMTDQEAQIALDWIDQHFSFLAPEDTSLDELLRLAHSRIMQTGAKLVVIDPWNEVMNKRPGGISETDFIGQCLSRIRRFAQSHDVHFVVIAHPTKLPKDDETGEYIVPGPYDAAGSANWFNRADNFISVWRRRHYEEGEEKQPTQIHVQKIRWKDVGQLGMAELRYQWETGRYFDLDASDDGPMKYAQMDDPWLDSKGPGVV